MDGKTAELLPVSAQKRRLKEEAYDNKKGRDGRKNERKIKIKDSEKHRFGKNGGRQKKEKIQIIGLKKSSGTSNEILRKTRLYSIWDGQSYIFGVKIF